LKFTRKTAPPPFSGVLNASHPLCYVSFSVPCLLFSLFFFSRAGVRLSRELCLFIPEVAVGELSAVYLLTCWSVSAKQVRSQHLAVWEPSWFLSVTWHVRAGGSGCQTFASSWWFCQVWLQHLSKIFALWSSCCLLPPSSHHFMQVTNSVDLETTLWPKEPCGH
jgi:hypothetical protein